MTTVRLIGSNILFDLASCNYSKDFSIADSILWHSPFAMMNLDYECNTSEENINWETGESAVVLSLELKKDLEEIINKDPTEYIIIESMGACWYELFEKEGKIYTKSRFVEKSEWYKEHKDEFNVINLRNNPEFNWEKYYDKFIQIIRKYYPANKIVYVRSYFPRYGKVKNFLKDLMIPQQSNKLMREIDEYFIQKADCKVITIGEYFFSDVQSKYGSKICFYENDFYTTLLENINYAILDKSGEKIYSKIKYSVRIRRYLECYESIQFNKLVSAFWNMEVWLEKLTYLLGKKALLIFQNQLTNMSENDVKCISDMETYANKEDIRELLELAYVIKAIEEKNYGEKVNWHLAFSYEIEALKKLNLDINRIVKDNYKIDNIDFMIEKNFKLVQACIFKNISLENIFSLLLEKQYGIDIWGSCVTREIFNNGRVRVGGVKKYVCRNCLLFSFDKPVDNTGLKIDFSNLSDFGNNPWRRKVVQSSLNRENVKWLEESCSEWLVLDLYDIAKKNIFKYKNEYFCLGGRWLSYNFYKKIADKIEKVNVFNFDDKYLKEKFDQFILFVKKRYGKNIILCNVTWCDKYIDSSDKIQYMSEAKEANQHKTAFVRKWESYLRHNLDCYYIDIAKFFYADEMNPYILSGVHYEMAYYDEMAKMINEIITCKPEKRVYEEVSVKCTLERAIRLKSLDFDTYNQALGIKDNVALKLIYFCERLLIEKYIDVFEQIYRNNYDSIRSCCEMFHYELWNATELKAIFQKYAE